VKPRPAAAPPRDHYSYRVYADPATAQTFDDRRFGGPIGELVAATQARVLSEFLAPEGRTILDVGTGTGRAALLLARGGADVIGVDASEEMLAVARSRAAADGLRVRFEPGDAHALAFADRSVDAAVSLRVLMHTPDWRRCVAELCRVARDLVVVDYPAAASAALAESIVRRATHAAGARTEPYRVFTDAAIARAFAECGYRVRRRHRLFVLPIALHKAIGSREFTERSERVLDRAGLLRLFGSPVTLVAERCASS
jgi:2-polyprenyl-3-methyl-5-hydroxy-6-metoxy-1,4-benzoquinol methylase